MLRNRLFLLLSLTILLAVSFAYYTKEDKSEVVAKVTAEKIEKVGKKEEVEKAAPIKNVPRDQMRRFFSKGVDKFPFVETIRYTSRVDWLKGRPAWLGDFARHYKTSKHFIARSLNGKEDYISQNVSPGDQFNVLNPEKEISFHLLVNLSTCTLDFSYKDEESGKSEFIKQYKVGIGRKDEYSPSGSLTPLGKYKLGEKIAIYKRGVESYFQKQKTHMIEVFGTRWIPFQEEVEGCTDSAKGYGIHGLPFVYNEEDDSYKEDIAQLGAYSSDGCVRLSQRDIEELFSIIITKPTYIQIIKEHTSEQDGAGEEE
ncbi:L,D-transpeptidase [bacterium]|nr:L,D-transpeptidase [bacterium]